ncbi:MAG: pyruvate kinase [bacterium]|nr:pyruvate kinase [bacterium]
MLDPLLSIKKTRVIATIGPASDNPEIIKNILEAGANIIRLNSSHLSDPVVIREKVEIIRKTARELNLSVGILLDLQGPKIRLGTFKNKKAEIKAGNEFILTVEKCEGNSKKVQIIYPDFIKDVSINDTIYIDDGRVELQVETKLDKEIVCRVIQGGIISDKKGVNLPDTRVSMSPVTVKDKIDSQIAVDNFLDYIALSFVSNASDIKELREHLHKLGSDNIKIIAKIERQFALNNIEEIVNEADAVMVARGDLGVETGIENVPKAQKTIISLANRYIKPVIVATQMLESMITSRTATRAEASDVANAIFDKCDAVMLSGETAVGVDPVNAVKTMNNICLASECFLAEQKKGQATPTDIFVESSAATSLCIAADRIAEENNARTILAFTISGHTALIASKLHSITPVIAPTDNYKTFQEMSLYRGIIPILLNNKFKEVLRWRDLIPLAKKEAKKLGYIKTSDIIVAIAGIPFGEYKGPNSIRILKLKP